MRTTSSSSSVGIPQQPGTDSLGVQVNQGPLCVAGQLEGAQGRHGKSSCCLRDQWEQKVHLASCPGLISAARLLNCLPGHEHGATQAKTMKENPATPNCVFALAGEATLVSTEARHQWQYYSPTPCPGMYSGCVH